MTIIKLEEAPANGDALAVKLSLNMSKYCKASRELFAAEKLHQETATQKSAQEKELDVLLALVEPPCGAEHWKNIIISLGEMNNLRAGELIFPVSLFEKNQEVLPLAMVVLTHYFAELLKNSIDAIIDGYIDGASNNDQLSIVIQFRREGSDLIITVADNAGGISPEFEARFKKRIEEGDFKPDGTVSKKKAHKKYYMGGKNMGAISMACLALKGELLSDNGTVKKEYIVPVTSEVATTGSATTTGSVTKISIENNSEKTGAVVTVRSPLQAFPAYMEAKITKNYTSSPLLFHKKLALVAPPLAGNSSPEIPGESHLRVSERRKKVHLTFSLFPSISSPDAENCNPNLQSKDTALQ